MNTGLHNREPANDDDCDYCCLSPWGVSLLSETLHQISSKWDHIRKHSKMTNGFP